MISIPFCGDLYLGWNLKHLVGVVDDLQQQQVGFKVLAGAGVQIDTTTANGRLVFGILPLWPNLRQS